MFTNVPFPLPQSVSLEDLKTLARHVSKHATFIGKIIIKERKGFRPSVVVVPKWADKLEEALNEANQHFLAYDVDVEEPPQP